MTFSTKRLVLFAKGLAVSVVALASSVATADPLLLYGGPAITDAMKSDTRACLNVGDAVSCSAGMLNVLSGLSDTQKTTDNPAGFVFPSPQGALKSALVLATGGNAATGNGDVNPTGSNAEDGFKSNNAGDTFAATGKTGIVAGNLGNPANNSLTASQDALGTWDVDINWLIAALSTSGGRREIMIGFDFNQSQGGSAGTLDYWSLITVRDLLNPTGLLDKNFEIKKDNSGYNVFNSGKTFNSQPNGSEFSTVNVKTCYLTVAGVVTDVIPITGGSCPAGYGTVNNTTGTSTTEILAFLPELNSNLEAYRDLGYDTISVRMLFGCFDKVGDPKSGVGYLSGGSTSNCDGGGNVDVYLLAGQLAPQQVPEPQSLALFGLALGALACISRRRRTI